MVVTEVQRRAVLERAVDADVQQGYRLESLTVDEHGALDGAFSS